MINGKVLAAKFTKNTFDETIGEQDSYRPTFSLWVGSGSDLRPSQFVIQWVDIGHMKNSLHNKEVSRLAWSQNQTYWLQWELEYELT